MKLKRSRTYTEILVLFGCFLLVFLSVVQIVVFSHRARTVHHVAVTSMEQSTSTTRGTKTTTTATPRHVLKARAQKEIRELEKALAKLIRESSMTPDEAYTKYLSDLYVRRIQNIILGENSRLPHKYSNSYSLSWNSSSHSVTYAAIEGFSESRPNVPYGIPFHFKRSNLTLVTNLTNSVTRSSPHFRDSDPSEESEFKLLLSHENVTISQEYEDTYDRIKQQYQEGTELYVDEEKFKKSSKRQLDLCPKEPASLVGNTTDVILNISVSIDLLNQEHNDVMPGGEWKPSSCIARHRVAIVIPYRDRWNHLKVLLYYLIPTLKRQQLHFRIFVVEQYGNETFNKGRIMNVAFLEALPLFDFQCVAFHDVDLVPEDDRNMYSCTEQPKHMSIGIDKFHYFTPKYMKFYDTKNKELRKMEGVSLVGYHGVNYWYIMTFAANETQKRLIFAGYIEHTIFRLPYQGLVGGVLMFRADHFQLVNGYSNMYWGWGAEDDDMTTRILHRGLRIYRPPSNIARYKMVKHEGRKGSEVAIRMKLLRSAAKRSKLEGLNNVQYKLLSTQMRELFTHFIVDVGTP